MRIEKDHLMYNPMIAVQKTIFSRKIKKDLSTEAPEDRNLVDLSFFEMVEFRIKFFYIRNETRCSL